MEEDQKKNFYTMRDDSEDGDKENKDGDRDKGTLMQANQPLE